MIWQIILLINSKKCARGRVGRAASVCGFMAIGLWTSQRPAQLVHLSFSFTLLFVWLFIIIFILIYFNHFSTYLWVPLKVMMNSVNPYLNIFWLAEKFLTHLQRRSSFVTSTRQMIVVDRVESSGTWKKLCWDRICKGRGKHYEVKKIKWSRIIIISSPSIFLLDPSVMWEVEWSPHLLSSCT